MNILKQSPEQSFGLTQIVESLMICSPMNGHGLSWGNVTEKETQDLEEMNGGAE
ncbi:hypothetical protein H1P_5060002 [Hyella patelloides LEGE 07179]|uniref:Uncharacterized protein n=1 Tax=Hyella patelloides LEGE 07179 TaxID=945734 RepID=A0A563VZK4_9CYAN|nr:hypothetical protein [Hyella patelloides]VEP16888.1 hypothetical protein H1P_5060002 [Hyella patelloides LEGE 07179]